MERDHPEICVLVVDDQPITRARFAALVDEVEGVVTVVSSLIIDRLDELFRAHSPCAVIVSIPQAVAEAEELLEHLRQMDEDCRIVVVSGHAGREFKEHCLRAGADDFVARPDFELVQDIVNELRSAHD